MNEHTHEGMSDVQSPYKINENTLIYISTDGVGYSIKMSELLGFFKSTSAFGVDIKRLTIFKPKFDISEPTHLQLIVSTHPDYSEPIYELDTKEESTRSICRAFTGESWDLFPEQGLDAQYDNKAIVFYLDEIKPDITYYCKYRYYSKRINQDWYGFTGPSYTPDIVNDVHVYDKELIIEGPSELWEGDSGSYTCTLVRSDGTRKVITPEWSSTLFPINSNGVLTTSEVDSDKTVIITATYEGLVGTKSVVVLNDRIVELNISGPSEIPMRNAQPVGYTAIATYRRGRTRDVTLECTWRSSATRIESNKISWDVQKSDISTTITASIETVSNNYPVLIKYDGLIRIEIVGPDEVPMPIGSQSYSVIGIYTDGTEKVINSNILTSNSKTSISNNILSWDPTEEEDILTVLQTTYIDPEFPDDDPYINSKSVRIKYMGVKEIRIEGETRVCMDENSSAYRVIATLIDDSELDITSESTLITSNPKTQIRSGILSWDKDREEYDIVTTLSASYKTKPNSTKVFTSSLGVTIWWNGIESLVINGLTTIPIKQGSSSYTAVGRKVDGTTLDITSKCIFTSSSTNISNSMISWDPNGTEDITTTVSAVYKQFNDSTRIVQGSISVLINYSKIIKIEIVGESEIRSDQSLTLTCIATREDDTTEIVTPTWSISGGISTINSSGLVSAGTIKQEATSKVTAVYNCPDGVFNASHSISEIKEHYAILSGTIIGEGLSASFESEKLSNLEAGVQSLTFIVNQEFTEGYPLALTFEIEGGTIENPVCSAVFMTRAGIKWTSELGYLDGRYCIFDFYAAKKLVSITISIEVE